MRMRSKGLSRVLFKVLLEEGTSHSCPLCDEGLQQSLLEHVMQVHRERLNLKIKLDGLTD